MMNSVPDFHRQITEGIQNFRKSNSHHALFEPVDYLMGIGGKRMRPILTLMGCELFGGNTEDAMPAALAVEVFHNFTLMHDDIMDKAPLRRGHATVHEKWNINTAILSGDAMLIMAYELLSKSPPSKLAALLEIFNKAATGVCIGQQLDMNFECRKDVTVDEYIEMIRLKTAVLLGGALDLGATVADADRNSRNHLSAFGEHLGVSFQLRDDYLDAFGNPAVFGKQIGGDILSDKKTFLHIRTFEKASTEQRMILDDQLGPAENTEQKIRTVRDLMQKLNVENEVLDLSKSYFDSAMEHLRNVNTPEINKTLLRELASQLLNRQS